MLFYSFKSVSIYQFSKAEKIYQFLVQVVIDTRSDPVLLPIVKNWIILMHRFDGSVNFYRNWTEYRNGFGDVGRGEFWLGNDRIHCLTKKGRYTLRIEVKSQYLSYQAHLVTAEYIFRILVSKRFFNWHF